MSGPHNKRGTLLTLARPIPNYQLHSGNNQVHYQLQDEEITAISPHTPIEELSEEEVIQVPNP
jgi:hypothetical protein